MSGRIRSSRTFFLTGALAFLLVVGKPLHGQNQQIAATLSGTVTDPTGSTVNGAKVTLRSLQNGIVRTYLTQNSGLFTFTLLPPAAYILTSTPAASRVTSSRGSRWKLARALNRTCG